MTENDRLARLCVAAGLPTGPTTPLYGGNMGAVVRAGDWVLKTCMDMPETFFEAEANGLRSLREMGIRTPKVRHVCADGLVMEYMPPGPSQPRDLAEQLSNLHKQRLQNYGWHGEVFIGRYALKANQQNTDWQTFWFSQRINPLLRDTWKTLGPLGPRLEALHRAVHPPSEGPCLIHGDLWSGNVVMTHSGACLIDPSCWIGERAVDLAMMKLFGGFSDAFWTTYEARLPIPAAVAELIPFYQLYYLLVHVHFFGRSYLGSVERILKNYLH